MENLIKYWKGNEKALTFFLLVQLPFLFVHEVSHLLFHWFLGVKQKISSIFFMIKVNGILQTGMKISILGGNRVAIIIGTLAPTIVWIGILALTSYNVYYNHSIVSGLVFIYCILGAKTANCSKVDLITVLKCIGFKFNTVNA